MERFAYEICGAKNIALTLQLDKLETKDLTMDQRKNMYLIFKEALNNAVKYSGTEKIAVSAANGNNVLTMIVKDEGKGFDTGTVVKGNGLENIQTRAASVGGKLSIDSAPGNGTTVKLIMPLTL
jgi:signal transduction histidine kinase